MKTLNKLKSWAKNSLSQDKKVLIKKRGLPILALFFKNNLNQLATIYGTDKWNCHWYTKHYQKHFSEYKNKPIHLLEIGVGGCDNPRVGGNSLFMWKSYFPKAKIFSLDIYDKKPLEQKRIKIFQGSQDDPDFLSKVVKDVSGLDIIIDDGSHLNEHVIKSFEILFPLLNDGGWYVVEDMHTAYWNDFGGDSQNLEAPQTSVNYFRRLVHCLNYQELIDPSYQPTYFDQHITEIHFYHNIVFIKKGHNNESNNLVLNNQFIRTE